MTSVTDVTMSVRRLRTKSASRRHRGLLTIDQSTQPDKPFVPRPTPRTHSDSRQSIDISRLSGRRDRKSPLIHRKIDNRLVSAGSETVSVVLPLGEWCDELSTRRG